MRTIDAQDIIAKIKDACISAANDLPDDVLAALERAVSIEESPSGKEVLRQLVENANIARGEQLPICQDTGFAVVFATVGQDIIISGGSLSDAINEGVRRGYSDGYLRKSIVRHPLERVNTGDNTPAVIHYDYVPGDELAISILPKGGGCENMSVAKSLKPADGREGVIRFVAETVKNAGSNPCPPLVVGVGLGGTIDKAAVLSKKATLRTIGEPSSNPIDAALEADLMNAVNATGVGPSGYGGRVTALAVNVESFPCHIASLPVAITIQCHAARHKTVRF